MAGKLWPRLAPCWAGLVACGTLGMATAVSSNGSVNSFDYVIVGGGLSGLVVANRLSENPAGMVFSSVWQVDSDLLVTVSVLVLEYGRIDRSNQTLWPGFAQQVNTADIFNISSAPEPAMENKTFGVLAGAVAGGGSTVNGMELDRASAADYNSWELLGNPGWGWNDLFPYFKKVGLRGVAPVLA